MENIFLLIFNDIYGHFDVEIDVSLLSLSMSFMLQQDVSFFQTTGEMDENEYNHNTWQCPRCIEWSAATRSFPNIFD